MVAQQTLTLFVWVRILVPQPKALTNAALHGIVNSVVEYGGVSEWFKELVLKTSDPARDQEFESLLLRQFARFNFYG